MTVVPIVEGHGDVRAVPVLLRRLVGAANAWKEVRIDQAVRCSRGKLVKEVELKKRVRLASRRKDCGAILIIFDSDDDCPVELAAQVREWAVAEAGPVCEVVLAKREYEAWFLAAIESLRTHPSVRADARSHPDPEAPRGAKDKLEAMMHISYSETTHQPAFSKCFCMAAAYVRCRSFRKLISSFGRLMESLGADLSDWSPRGWQETT